MANKKTDPVIKVRQYRLKAGLSQNALAKLADVSQSHISEIESGVKRVGLEITRKLSKALDVPIEELINEVEESDLEEKDLTEE